MKKLITLSLLFLYSNQYLLSQENITNVDTNYLYPAWMPEDLKVKIFSNGDSLKYIDSKTISEDNPFNRSTSSAYTTKIINGKEVYFYNYNAVQDSRKLAPKGYRIPTANDYIQLRNKGTKFIIDKTNKTNSLVFVFDTVGYFESLYEKSDCKCQSYWIKSNNKGEDTEAPNFFLDDNNNYTLQIWSKLQDDGLPVRYIEDLSESIKTKTYDYRLLMPNDFNTFKKQIWDQFPFKNEYENGSEINITALINFNKNGENTSKISSFDTEKFHFDNDIVQINTLQQFIKNRLTKPIYYGENVISQSDLNIVVKFNRKYIEDYSGYYNGIYETKVNAYNRLSSSFIGDIFTAKENGIPPIFEYKIKTLYINNKVADSITKYVITSFNSRYIQNTFYAFLPGLGVLHAEPSRKKIPGIKMIHISIPIGIISLASYFYYSSQYNQYLKSSNFSTDTYRSANNAHKVFLTTATAYALLGLIDFSTTINIGRKNKKLAKRINEEINKNYNGGLLLN